MTTRIKGATPPAHVEAPAGAASGLRPEVLAFASTQPVHLAALVAAQHAPAAFRGDSPSVDPLAFADAIERQVERVQAGDLSDVDASLVAQAIALQSLFAELSTKAARSKEIESKSLFYGLALRAQNQANATLKTLVELKQPRQAVFTKNAAVHQGSGTQQVAIGVPAASRAQARDPVPAQNEMEALEEVNGSTSLDAGATLSAIGSGPGDEALASRNRPAKQGRKAHVLG